MLENTVPGRARGGQTWAKESSSSPFWSCPLIAARFCGMFIVGWINDSAILSVSAARDVASRKGCHQISAPLHLCTHPL